MSGHWAAGALAIWAISWWPAFNFFAANWKIIEANGRGSVVWVLAISLAMALTGHAVWRWQHRRNGVVVIWVAGICLFFGYLFVRNLASRIFVGAGLSWPGSAVWFVLFAVVATLAWRYRNRIGTQRASIAFAIVASTIAAGTLGVNLLTGSSVKGDVDTAGAPRTHGAGAGGVNIYYIILDAYPGPASLQRDFGYDDSPFLTKMAAKGFRALSRERSNYLMTTQTIAGIFSLDYPETGERETWRDPWRHYPALFDRAVPPPLIRELQSEGYSTWFSGSLLSGCPVKHMRCLDGAGANAALYTLQAFLAPTPVGRLLMHLLESRRDALTPLEDFLPTLAEQAGRKFVFAHHLSPHPPNTVHRDCRPGGHDYEVNGASARAAFIESVECVNLRVERLADRILAQDPSALIVFQSDHGSEFSMDWNLAMAQWKEESIRERASYLNLVRAPVSCQPWLDRPLGQVNTARFALACAEGRAPTYLPERSFLSTYSRGPESGQVIEWTPAGASRVSLGEPPGGGSENPQEDERQPEHR